MIEYKVVTASFDVQIEEEVNNAIIDGWEPLGGIQIVVIDQYFNKRYCQAMTRDKRKAEATEKRHDVIRERASAGIDQVLEEYAEEN